MRRFRPAALLLSSLVAATAIAANTAGLYKAGAGPYPVGVAADMQIFVSERQRELLLRVSYPEADGPFPLIVFFHGALCSGAGYAALADHWASHGYVVILPSHPGSERAARGAAEAQIKMFHEQVEDMSSIIDSLEVMAARIEALQGNIDATRIAGAGHSMGALIATVAGGLPRLAAGGAQLSMKDERLDALVLLSGPGPLPMTPPDGWDHLTLPILATTGTQDHANRGGEGATWEWRLGTYRLTPPGNKFALVIDEADHFLGGMLCPERAEGPRDREAWSIVASVSTAFLDVYLRDDEAASIWLGRAPVAAVTSGRGELLAR